MFQRDDASEQDLTSLCLANDRLVMSGTTGQHSVLFGK